MTEMAQTVLPPLAHERAVVCTTLTMPLRDGTELLARLHTRADGEPRPVLLIRTPYGEPMSRQLPVLPALELGFAVVVQQCRGTGGSGGQLRTFENERDDGLDTLAWLRAQPFCDGRIAMFGQSYLGMTQMAVAGHNPEGLAAISPLVTPHDYRDGLVFRQGVFQLGQAVSWHLLKAVEMIQDRRARGEDVRELSERLAALAGDPDTLWALPLIERPVLSELLPSWRTWLERENDTTYWRSISYSTTRSASRVPALHVGGWYDLFLAGTLDNYRVMAERTGRQHLIIGPWSHADYTGVTGELAFPRGGARDIGLEAQQLRFLRSAVDGQPIELPPVQLYVTGSNTWRSFRSWPPAEAVEQRWHLHQDGSLTTEASEEEDAQLTWVHDPMDPVPTVGGSSLISGGLDGRPSFAPGPRDQRPLDSRTDMLRFTSVELTEDVEVIGPVAVTVHVATTGEDADVVARLIDIHPDGRAMGIVDGIVRLRYRAGMDSPRPVPVGSVVEAVVDLVGTAHTFRRGHRIRVDIAGSDHPKYDANSASGKPVAQVTPGDLRTATNTLYLSRSAPSWVSLPVVPARHTQSSPEGGSQNATPERATAL